MKTKTKTKTVPYPSVFLGVPVFRGAWRGEKTVVQLESLGVRRKPSPVGFRGKAPKIFGYFPF